MAKQNVLEMLRKPVTQKPDSPESKPASSFESAVISECHRLLAAKDAQIETLTRTVDMLTQQVSNSREKASLPEFVLEVSGHDQNGRIRTVTAKPRRA